MNYKKTYFRNDFNKSERFPEYVSLGVQKENGGKGAY